MWKRIILVRAQDTKLRTQDSRFGPVYLQFCVLSLASRVMIVCVFILLAALPAYPAPQWASIHKHPKYPPESYFISVGTSSVSLDEAKDAARVDMAKQIRVQIKGDFLVKRMSTQIGEEYYYRKDVKSRTESFVDEKLVGVRIVETADDDGIFYALAVLDRAKIGSNFIADIEDGIETVNELLTNADELLRSGNISGALADLAQAHTISYDITLKRSLFQIISPKSLSISAKAQAKSSPPMILSQIRDILSRLRLVRVSGDGQIGEIGKPLSESLVVQLNITTENGNMIPVEGMEIRFESGSAELIEKQLTDRRGEASVMFTVRAPEETASPDDAGSVSSETKKVMANLTLGKLPEELEGTLPVVYTVLYYGIERDTYPVRLSILSNGENLLPLESKVKRSLNKLGYVVERDARISLEGKLAVSDVREMGGLRPQTLVLVELDLSILDAEEGAVLDSASFSGKGLGRSEEKAFEKAAAAVNISERKLSTLLQAGRESFAKARERRSQERFEEGEQLFNAGRYKAALRKLEGVAIGTEVYEKAQKLVGQIMASMPPVPRPSIAIFEPRHDGSRKQRETARTLMDMMTTAFIRDRELKVVERERLEEMMGEIELGLGGYVDQAQAAQVGRLAGAEALLLSSLRTVGGNVEIDAKLIKTETSESLAAAMSEGSHDELRVMAEDIADQIVGFLDDPFRPKQKTPRQ